MNKIKRSWRELKGVQTIEGFGLSCLCVYGLLADSKHKKYIQIQRTMRYMLGQTDISEIQACSATG